MKFQMVLGLAAALLAAPAALGDITIGSLNDTTNSTSGHTYLGQTFTAPVGEDTLISASMMLHDSNGAGDSNGFWRIYTYDGGTNILGSQIDSAPITVYDSDGPILPYTQTFNVPVVAGNQYALIIDWGGANNAGGYYSNSSYYSGGAMILSSGGNPTVYGSDMAFEITFGQVPEPALLGVLAPLMLLVRRRRPM